MATVTSQVARTGKIQRHPTSKGVAQHGQERRPCRHHVCPPLSLMNTDRRRVGVTRPEKLPVAGKICTVRVVGERRRKVGEARPPRPAMFGP